VKDGDMKNALRFDEAELEAFEDPTTGSGMIKMFEEALGQEGRPFVLHVQDPPNKTRPRHHHHGDVIYFYVQGEHHIEGEGIYRAGDVRWTRAGHAYGPETTGPEGGTWWVISYADPIPVDHEKGANGVAAPAIVKGAEGRMPEFVPDYDWDAIDATVLETGGVILKDFYDGQKLAQLNDEIDGYLVQTDKGGPNTGDKIYDMFLGHKTVRLHGLADKFESAPDLISDERLVSWAERMTGPNSHSVLLNAGELIQISPGESTQFLHRDSDSWPGMSIGPNPVVVNAIVALDDFTLENGATFVTPGSWAWDRSRQPTNDEMVRAVMKTGDAVLFRADLIHGGGANESSARRRGISLTYCAGWLRPVENSILNLPPEKAASLPEKVTRLLGYASHDASSERGGLLGLYEGGDPAAILTKNRV
jgi:ectoine hydroxylase-related dioxygenase (phytanoyl-CoA dioxygenase family)